MVLNTSEIAKHKVGSCERITMKLKSILNISRLDCSDRRIEEGPREFHKIYKLGGILGKGGFGTVFAAIRKKDKLQVAVKEVYKAKIIKKTADGKTPLEVALMQQVRDVPGAIRILDWFEMSESFFIVMEKFTCQDLFDYISEHGPMKESKARVLFKQVLNTVLMCHNNGVLHRDIKDENILIDVQSKQLKLIDFGSGTYLHDGLYNDFEGNKTIYCVCGIALTDQTVIVLGTATSKTNFYCLSRRLFFFNLLITGASVYSWIYLANSNDCHPKISKQSSDNNVLCHGSKVINKLDNCFKKLSNYL